MSATFLNLRLLDELFAFPRRAFLSYLADAPLYMRAALGRGFLPFDLIN